ncbi:MAG: DEAD/DEAH box helicase [Gammaproteobacteria bacterium]|nr:DEAD/DEAH box helicase [Gammaproteobacteria bacterium]
MNPAILSHHIHQAFKEYLHLTFDTTTPFFQDMVERFLHNSDAILKGPYLSLNLPFLKGQAADRHYFDPIDLGFVPYLHQLKAFERLADKRLSTLVATGTGSGKTESFLYPILAHCRASQHPGIKAIIIYPMNALATDQASRIARIIHQSSSLRGRVTAGLFVGDKESNPSVAMEPTRVITDKSELRNAPPDILLTNYKMLDFLLIRAVDGPLWRHNQPETLRFLVVDELHTFDGAQGTDLACLIRRLKARLETPEGQLICVGTSATMGESEGGGEGVKELRGYAEAIFSESFDDNAVVGEFRQSLGDYLADETIEELDYPVESEKLNPDNYPDLDSYLQAQVKLWFDCIDPKSDPLWQVALGKSLKGHFIFHNLLRFLHQDQPDWQQLNERIAGNLFRRSESSLLTERLLLSLFTLIGAARQQAAFGVEKPEAGFALRPFLDLRSQIWLRELRRMVVTVPAANSEPVLHYADDGQYGDQVSLPMAHCRHCREMGWITVRADDNAQIGKNLSAIYAAFFSRSRQLRVIYPADSANLLAKRLCSCCGAFSPLRARQCSHCGTEQLLAVWEPDLSETSRSSEGSDNYAVLSCPYCHSENSLLIVGMRATSLTALIASELSVTSFNRDRQLIVFSDSVQDAAHRAGFVEARSHSNPFRVALLQYMQQQDGGLPMDKLLDDFPLFWQQKLGDADFIGNFIPVDMQWLRDYGALLRSDGQLPEGSDLVELVSDRLRWSLIQEFSQQVGVGRSLESLAELAVGITAQKIHHAALHLQQIYLEEHNLKNLELDHLKKFITGFLYHLRLQGGIAFKGADLYLYEEGKSYLLTQQGRERFYMPGLRFPPRYLAERRCGALEVLTTHDHSWYKLWFVKTLLGKDKVTPSSPILFALYLSLLKSLVKASILFERSSKTDVSIWGIEQSALEVESPGVRLVCDCCHHTLTIRPGDRQIWLGIPCLRNLCMGHLQEDKQHSDSHFRRLFSQGEINRITAREHTGLLDRDTRQAVENSFKRPAENRQSWDCNLLSATPTLEMGVDIGDLSSVLLCSVPPSPANYLQRIGRAGRRDGNAMAVTLANGVSHDLYFYQQPLLMLRGKVETPGVFLDAAAVLERQFTAFTLDSWVAVVGESAVIPPLMRHLLQVVKKSEGSQNRFPYVWLNYVEQEGEQLLHRFYDLFSRFRPLSDSSKAGLKLFALGNRTSEGSISFRIEERLRAQLRETESITKERDRCQRLVKEMEKKALLSEAEKEKLRELKQEHEALKRLKYELDNREPLQFFTNEGLIPNYAFPEQGVLLRSVIWRSSRDNSNSLQNEGSRGESEQWFYEYERPAASALSEFAPLNSFYAGGRRVQVSRIDMRLSEEEVWRFCPACHFSQRLDIASEQWKSCPRCGDVNWSDEGQKQVMLRLRQVYAATADRKSRIADDKDDRDSQFYQRQMLVDFEQDAVTAAYRIQQNDWPFGYEFLSRATFREFNAGEHSLHGEMVAIAGRKEHRSGFRVCRYCGTVQQKREQQHTRSCTNRSTDDPSNLMQGLWLYREFSSEAIRILLPVTSGESGEMLENTFVALLHLALRHRFGGRIDHLRITQSQEPDRDSGMARHYLVIYDTVPGGTGYLKQLTHSAETLIDLLLVALPLLTGCQCVSDVEADGCYQCLYAYRNSRDMRLISRRGAVEFLQQLQGYRHQLHAIERLSLISMSGLVESELEARFIEAIQKWGGVIDPFVLRKEFMGSYAGWYLRLGEKRYFIRPQVEIGKADGVELSCRADFVITPQRSDGGLRAIAVFTDGFRYHHNQVEKDFRQRNALVASGNYWVWSLSYEDVVHSEQGQADLLLGLKGKAIPFLQQFGCEPLLAHSMEGSMQWLLRLLQQGDDARWQGYSQAVTLIWANLAKKTALCPLELWPLPPVWREMNYSSQDSSLWIEANGVWRQLFGEYGALGISVDVNALQQQLPGAIGSRLLFDDSVKIEHKTDWNAFLRLTNLLQFNQGHVALTRKGVDSGSDDLHAVILLNQSSSNEVVKSAGNQQWHDLFGDAVDEEILLLQQLQSWGLAAPELSYELLNSSGEIVAQAVVAWSKSSVAVIESAEESGEFVQQGWQTVVLSELQESEQCPDIFLECYNEV